MCVSPVVPLPQVADAGRRLGFTVPDEHADHIVGLYPSAAMPDAEWFVALLEAEGVYVAARWCVVATAECCWL